MKIISKTDFDDFVNNLIKDDSLNVIGVKSRGNKYAFAPLETANELRLDYDVTLLPPKKYFFPSEKHYSLMRYQEDFPPNNQMKQNQW